MQLSQLRSFVRTVDLLSFRKSAAALGISQPSVSRAVQALEREFGGELLLKRRSRMQVSELGRIVLPQIKVALDMLDEVSARAQAYAEDGRKALHVVISEDARACLKADGLDGLMSLAGTVGMTIAVLPQDQAKHAVDSGRFDLGILLGDEERGPERRKIATSQVVVAYSGGLTFADTVGYDDLDRLPFVVDSRKAYEVAFDSLMRRRGLAREARWSANDDHALARLFRAGMGCWLLPMAQADRLGLHYARLDEPAPKVDLVLATPRRRQPVPLATAIETLVASQIAA